MLKSYGIVPEVRRFAEVDLPYPLPAHFGDDGWTWGRDIPASVTLIHMLDGMVYFAGRKKTAANEPARLSFDWDAEYRVITLSPDGITAPELMQAGGWMSHWTQPVTFLAQPASLSQVSAMAMVL